MPVVLVGVPCPSSLDTRWVEHFLRWTSTSQHPVATILEPTPNRMDRSISNLIAAAKELRPAWLVRIDADVRPELPLDDCIRIAEENRRDGFVCTGSPTITEKGLCEWRTIDDGPSPNDRPFEVQWVSGSLVFCHQDAWDKFPARGGFSDGRGHEMKLYINVQRPETTEDVDFCEAVRSVGGRILADPRLMVQHRRKMELPSYRPPMDQEQRIVIGFAPVASGHAELEVYR